MGQPSPDAVDAPLGHHAAVAARSHPQAELLRQAYRAIGWTQIDITAGAANLVAALHTPRGRVTLESLGI